MIDTGLRTLLLDQSSITTLIPAQTINGTSHPAIFNEEPPEGVLPPFIVISLIANDPMLTLDGTYGMQASNFDIKCFAYKFEDAKTLSRTVRTFLDDYSGAAGGSDTINAVLLQGVSYDKLYNQDGTDSRQRIATLGYLIQHTEV